MIITWTENPTLTRVTDHLKQAIDDKYLADMAARCFLNTIETTVRWNAGELPYVLTGDIPAMWLRDSSAQLEPYVRFTNTDEFLQRLVHGIILRQAAYILEDPYANAFNQTASGQHGFPNDETAMGPWVYERKFEIDSLAHPIRLWWMYVHRTGKVEVLDGIPRQAVVRTLDVLESEQEHDAYSAYRFRRPHSEPSDTLLRDGLGPVSRPTGMIWSGFRPSDDATTYPYLVPAEMFLAVALDIIVEWAMTVWHDDDIRRRAQHLQSDILTGLVEYSLQDTPRYGKVWAYEVDGFGNALLMDDANIPSLLSLPFLNFCSVDHPVYQNTRGFVLSRDNPYYYQGRALSGVGSAHTEVGHVWPLAVIMEALTEPSQGKVWDMVRMLARADGGAGLMHESVHVDRPNEYTRPWFSWANSMFAELILRVLGYDPVIRAPIVSSQWG